MNHENILGIRVSQMRILVSTVDSENYTATAESLHYSQPFVSKTIASLEKTLGMKLFLNTQGHMHATPAAKLLAARWKDILRDFNDSVDSASRLCPGAEEEIRLGVSNLGMQFPRLINAISAFRESSPAQLTVSSHPMFDLEFKLLNNEMDMAVISRFRLGQFSPVCFGWTKLEDSCFAVFVPRGNELFERDRISIEDLSNQQFIVFAPDLDPFYDVPLKMLAEKGGFIPRIACTVPNEASFLSNMQVTRGIVIADDKTAINDSDVKMFPLVEFRNDVMLVYRLSGLTSSQKHFLDLLANP